MKNLGDEIKDYLENTLLVGEINSETPLIDGGYIDSIQILDLALFLEETFGLTLTAEDMQVENFASIDAIVAYVSHKTKTPS